jgi:YD repeat-containing protein
MPFLNFSKGLTPKINTAGTTSISYQYNALNRLTTMIDAAGTTQFTWKAWGGLATEVGPWANDTVTYGYNTARERNSLTLQQPSGSWSQTYCLLGSHLKC